MAVLRCIHPRTILVRSWGLRILNRKQFHPDYPVHLGPALGMTHSGTQADISLGGSQTRKEPKEPTFVWTPEECLKTVRNGDPSDPAFSVHFFDRHGGDAPISPWHSIPLALTSLAKAPFLYSVVEIPRGTRSKFEISTRSSLNPILRDVDSAGAPRSLRYVHPNYPDGIPFHYGAFPQTWESCRHFSFRRRSTKALSKVQQALGGKVDVDENDDLVRTLCNGSVIADCGLPGDNDPLDVVNISLKPREVGDVVRVRVLGAVPMIDGGEIDWKIVVRDADDDDLQGVRTIYDIDPRTIETVMTWLRDYKTVDGKGVQVFANGGEVLSLGPALRVIEEMHNLWDSLRRGCEGWATGDGGLVVDGLRPGVCAASDPDSAWGQSKWYWDVGGKGWGAT